jgi:hypothetical protein
MPVQRTRSATRPTPACLACATVSAFSGARRGLTCADHNHQFRRRIWDQAFTQPQLQTYGTFVYARGQEWLETVSKKVGQTIDFHHFASLCTFDVMSDLAFGGQTENIRNGVDKDNVIEPIRKATRLTTIGDGMSWLRLMLVKIAPVTEEFVHVKKYIAEKLGERQRLGMLRSAGARRS